MSITINGSTGISGVDGSSTTPAFQGTDTDTGLFYSANTVSISAGGSKVATINAYGIGLGTGSPSSGIGITFPATQSASSDANTLDDYEEGTWTPVVADATTGGNTGTYTNGGSNYVKVGKLVTLNSYLSVINTTGMTAGNRLIIRNLPFTIDTYASGNFYTYRVGRNASTVSSSILGLTGATALQFQVYTTNSATTDLYILVSNIVSGTSEIVLTLTYIAT